MASLPRAASYQPARDTKVVSLFSINRPATVDSANESSRYGLSYSVNPFLSFKPRRMRGQFSEKRVFGNPPIKTRRQRKRKKDWRSGVENNILHLLVIFGVHSYRGEQRNGDEGNLGSLGQTSLY